MVSESPPPTSQFPILCISGQEAVRHKMIRRLDFSEPRLITALVAVQFGVQSVPKHRGEKFE